MTNKNNRKFLIKNQIYWENRFKFIYLMKKYCNKTQTFEEFDELFTNAYYETRREVSKIFKNTRLIEKFELKEIETYYTSAFVGIFRILDEIDDEIADIKELDDYIKCYLEKIEKK